MNIIDGFLTGMRFRLGTEEIPDREAAYEAVFRALPASLAEGVYLYGGTDTFGRFSPEPAFLCAVGHLDLDRARETAAYFTENPALAAELTAFSPFVLSNYFERLETFEDLGIADAEGVLRGGNAAYGSMRFSGQERNRRGRPAALIGIGSGRESTFERTRRLGRLFGRLCRGVPARLLYASLAEGDLPDLMLSQARGRYAGAVREGETFRVGILPDRTVLLTGNGRREDWEGNLPEAGCGPVVSAGELMERRGGMERIRKDLIRALKDCGPVLVLGPDGPSDRSLEDLIRQAAEDGGHAYWMLFGSEEDGWEIQTRNGMEPFRSGETETALRILIGRMQDGEE